MRNLEIYIHSTFVLRCNYNELIPASSFRFGHVRVLPVWISGICRNSVSGIVATAACGENGNSAHARPPESKAQETICWTTVDELVAGLERPDDKIPVSNMTALRRGKYSVKF